MAEVNNLIGKEIPTFLDKSNDQIEFFKKNASDLFDSKYLCRLYFIEVLIFIANIYLFIKKQLSMPLIQQLIPSKSQKLLLKNLTMIFQLVNNLNFFLFKCH